MKEESEDIVIDAIVVDEPSIIEQVKEKTKTVEKKKSAPQGREEGCDAYWMRLSNEERHELYACKTLTCYSILFWCMFGLYFPLAILYSPHEFLDMALWGVSVIGFPVGVFFFVCGILTLAKAKYLPCNCWFMFFLLTGTYAVLLVVYVSIFTVYPVAHDLLDLKVMQSHFHKSN